MQFQRTITSSQEPAGHSQWRWLQKSSVATLGESCRYFFCKKKVVDCSYHERASSLALISRKPIHDQAHSQTKEIIMRYSLCVSIAISSAEKASNEICSTKTHNSFHGFTIPGPHHCRPRLFHVVESQVQILSTYGRAMQCLIRV